MMPTEWYKHAVEVMQILSKRDDISLILFTCSHPSEIEKYIEYFNSYNIKFDYINENPEVKTDTQGYGNYDKKFYMNILFDDKAGFDPHTDWLYILNELNNSELDLYMFDKTSENNYTLKDDSDITLVINDNIYQIYHNAGKFLKVLYNAPISSQRMLDMILEEIKAV